MPQKKPKTKARKSALQSWKAFSAPLVLREIVDPLLSGAILQGASTKPEIRKLFAERLGVDVSISTISGWLKALGYTVNTKPTISLPAAATTNPVYTPPTTQADNPLRSVPAGLSESFGAPTPIGGELPEQAQGDDDREAAANAILATENKVRQIPPEFDGLRHTSIEDRPRTVLTPYAPTGVSL